ncbi:YlbF family regulator [Maledivibacter halophilus]|uniref:Control of competence regulator ComK, YlbF/YmcA n=1 Tax=Maledivibacter halophilus TaxID=36842 RepID=A0A1T5IGR6_9FIRM|nr:YlbF family regulator [Maledivibacter halophilus]SKC38203.1 Control of competence regulator ComK, YlbF/YmcA [Maledivibacter halophilus]
MFFEKEINELVNSISKTNEFKEFKKAKANINKYPDLKEELEDFQKKQIDLYNMNMRGEKNDWLTSDLNRSFKKLSKFPEIHKLLSSGKEFNDMMFKLYKTINDLLNSQFEK